LQDQKENLVYLTADSETVLDELDLKKIYIIGGLVDRNRWKGITMKKASEQGIQTAKLPIGSYLKMSSSQV
jgi:tRNA (guanine9-N1)-methyltransferase